MTTFPLRIALLGLGLLIGCEAEQAMSSRAADPVAEEEVTEIERQVQAHLDRLNVARETESRGGDAALPDIHWNDPVWLAANRREQPAQDQTRTIVVAPSPPVIEETAEEPDPEPVVTPPAPPDRHALIAQLLQNVRDSDDPAMAKAMAMVGLSLADPDRPLDESLLQPLTPSQRRQVRRYHELVVAIGRTLQGDGDIDLAQISLQLNELFARPIAIKTFALCRRVDGYGLYEPFESASFPAGRPLRLGLYVELDHFGVETEADYHIVRLSQEISLFKDDLIVWREPVAEVVDRSRNRRRDFFTTQIIRLPDNLGTGRYTLKIRVTDHVSQTLDETTQTIELVADPAVAGASSRR